MQDLHSCSSLHELQGPFDGRPQGASHAALPLRDAQEADIRPTRHGGDVVQEKISCAGQHTHGKQISEMTQEQCTAGQRSPLMSARIRVPILVCVTSAW